MPARLFKPTDIIEVRVVPLLLYGGPGVGKTSLMQTADNPCTLDFNTGIHRSFNRKDTFQFDTWEDVIAEQKAGRFKPYSTLCIDTGGNLLEYMMRSVMAENSKFTQLGGLSQMGWGVLGRRFHSWLTALLGEGKSVVIACHEEDDKKADGERFVRPSLPGRMAYEVMHQNFDLIAQLYYEGDKRILNFSPSEKRVAKNSAGFKPFHVDRLEDDPTMLADILTEAKKKVGYTAEQSAGIARTVAEWRQWVEKAKLEQLNERVAAEFKVMDPVTKRQVWTMLQDYTAEAGVVFDNQQKKFVPDPNAKPKPAAVPEYAPGEVPNNPPAEGEHRPDPTPEPAPAPPVPAAAAADGASTTDAPASEKPKRGRKAAQEGAAP